MQFPTLVYKSPGPHKKPRGKTYAYRGAADQEEFDRLTGEGWAASYAEAVGDKPVDKSADKNQDRTNLESEAKELDIKFDGRTSDRKLAAMIAEALS